jgi:hypothetical protein
MEKSKMGQPPEEEESVPRHDHSLADMGSGWARRLSAS